MNYNPMTGRIINENGEIQNIVDLLGGSNPISDATYNIKHYAPKSGNVIGEDGKVYNLVQLIKNFSGGGGGGGGGGGPVAWSDVQGKPSTYPPTEHSHDARYYTKQDIDNAGYLLAQPDGETVHVQGGELKAKTLTGLQLGVSQLNAWLAGTEGNIQSQFNDIYMTLAALSSGMRYRGKFESKSGLDSVTIKDNGDLAVVLSDETRGGARSLYVYNDSLGIWDFVGAFEFSDAFTSLTDTPNAYDSGKLLRSGTNGLYFDTIKWDEIDGRPEPSKAAIEQAVNKAHTHAKTDAEISNAVELAHPHPNIAALNRIGIDAQGRITVDGMPYILQRSFLVARFSNHYTTSTDGEILKFDQKVAGDIPLNTSTGKFTLQAGKRYLVIANFNGDTQRGYAAVLYLRSNGVDNVNDNSRTSLYNRRYEGDEITSGNIVTVVIPTATQEYWVYCNRSGYRFFSSGTNLPVIEF